MGEKTTRKQFAILGALHGAASPQSSGELGEALRGRGVEISDRTIRLYLQELEAQGMTQRSGRKGHRLTELGLNHLEAARTMERVGFLSARIDQMTYGMNFDLARRSGTLIANVSVVDPKQLLPYLDEVCRVFECGYAMGNLMGLLAPGETGAALSIPPGSVGIVTVCSITLNGVLLKYGIPTHSRFGGLLEVDPDGAERFVEIINYDGTSIDPLEIFIRSGMTNYRSAVANRKGRIGAGFREFPEGSRGEVISLAKSLENAGLGGFMTIGLPGQPLLDVPVSEGRFGAIVIGGLNPLAILVEAGVPVQLRALADFVDCNRLFSYEELPERLKAFL